jgi:hypothetical protein
MPYKCFMVEPTGLYVVEASVSWPGCAKTPWKDGSHYATREVMQGTKAEAEAADVAEAARTPFAAICEYCGTATGLLRPQSTGSGCFWKRAGTEEIKRRISDFGVGAMWLVTWYNRTDGSNGERVRYGSDWDNQFEPPLMVHTPGGDWNIDSRASNCTLKNDRLHRCWIRHGVPPNITVDKAGKTCAAGAGSIQAGSYHGFLRNGQLT